jgi:LPS-assembly lipoprotein
MSFFDAGRPRALAALCLLAGGLVLSGCTGRPLYAGGLTADVMAPDGQLVSLRGRIAVSEAGNRTIQIVRNALLFRLNQGTRVSEPLYTVALSGSGSEIGIAVEPGGQAAASLYYMSASYTLTRNSDGTVLATGTRTETVPFDRTGQLYQSQRAVIDARDRAGKAVAGQIELEIGRALTKAGV